MEKGNILVIDDDPIVRNVFRDVFSQTDGYTLDTAQDGYEGIRKITEQEYDVVFTYLCDNLKVIITTNIPPHEFDNLMDIEIETAHHESLVPSHSVAKIADGLPGLGIVAAVLGVVLTMGKIDQPPSVLGHSIGAALVGTFLGVLMCYGFVGPMSSNLEHKAGDEERYFQVIKGALVAFVGGSAPQMAVEFARRAIPGVAKPSFNELETAVRGKAK